MIMKTALIVNPCAGQRRAMTQVESIARLFEAAGDIVAVFVTRQPGDGTRLAHKLSRHSDRLVCIGGDGTFHEVAQGVMQSQRRPPVGYIPAGTTNDMSRSLGLSHSMQQAARDILHGEARALDIGRFNDRAFTYVAAFGAFTRVSYRTAQTLKNMFGHAAYVWEGAKSIPHLHGWPMKIETPHRVYRGNYLYGSLSNAVSLGGVLRFPSGAVELGDGQFELLLIRSTHNPRELIECARSLLMRRFDSPLITLERVSQVKITADPRMSWALDGEFEPGARRVALKAVPGAISVIVPRRQLTKVNTSVGGQ